MVAQGHVGHEADGKTYRYSAKANQSKTTRLVIGDFLGRFFDGSVEALLMGLAESRELTPETWEKLNATIKKREESR